MFGRAWLTAVLALGWIGCGQNLESENGDQPAFSEHRVQVSGRATKQLGEDCLKEGASGCVSGLCLHTGAGPEEGYACSRQCTSSAQCPVNWRCVQVYPSDEGWLCTPPTKEAK